MILPTIDDVIIIGRVTPAMHKDIFLIDDQPFGCIVCFLHGLIGGRIDNRAYLWGSGSAPRIATGGISSRRGDGRDHDEDIADDAAHGSVLSLKLGKARMDTA